MSKRHSMSTITVLLSTTFPRMIIFKLLMKWLLGSNLSQKMKESKRSILIYHLLIQLSYWTTAKHRLSTDYCFRAMQARGALQLLPKKMFGLMSYSKGVRLPYYTGLLPRKGLLDRCTRLTINQLFYQSKKLWQSKRFKPHNVEQTESPGIENIYKKMFFQLRPNW